MKKLKNTIYIFIISILALSCNISKLQLTNLDQFEVIGLAGDSKAGAYIETTNKETYYIEGLDSWLLVNNGYYLDKQLLVTGTLILKPFPGSKKKINVIQNYEIKLLDSINGCK